MSVMIALVISILFGIGFYFLLQRSITRIVLGMLILSNVTNLFIFATPGLVKAIAPIMASDQEKLQGTFADPLPQALILTAIVIGLGIFAYLLALLNQMSNLKIFDADEMREE